MKLLCVSDLHLDAVTAGVRRLDDIAEAVNETVEAAIDEKVDGYVFGGDLCDPDSGPAVFAVLEVAIAAALRLQAHEIRNLWIAGNHDVIEDGRGGTTLRPLRAISDKQGFVNVHESPGVARIGDGYVFTLPYPTRARAYSPADAARHIVEKATTSIFVGPHVVFGHLTVPSAEIGSETTEMARGKDVLYPLEELAPLKGAVLMNGHYHKRQRTSDGVYIPGSLERLRFDEEKNEPGWMIVEL